MIDTSAFEQAWGEKPGPFHRGCWHILVNGEKITRQWGYWSKVQKDLEEWVRYGNTVKLLGSSVEKIQNG